MAGVSATNGEAAPRGLTPRQTLIWLDHELYPEAPIHTLVLTLRIEGPLDRARFETAFRDLVAQTDALRMVVEHGAAGPAPRVLPELPVSVKGLDFREHPERFTAWFDARCAVPLSTRRAMFDAALVQLGEDEHLFVLLLDHLIVDGVSMQLIASGLRDRYVGATSEQASSFLEFAEFERGYRASQSALRDAAYWENKGRRGTPPVVFYGRRRTRRSVGIERVWRDGNARRFELLRRLVSEDPFRLGTPALSRLVAFAAVLFAYLHRVTETRDLAVAMPVQNRPARFRRTIGLLMEQPILRVEVEDGETFRSLAAKVRTEVFESLRRARHCTSDRGAHHAMLNVWGPEALEFGDLKVLADMKPAVVAASELPPVEADSRDTFGLQIVESEATGELRFAFDFHRDTFEAALRERAADHFMGVLDALLANPSAAIDTIDLLDPAQRRALLEFGRGPEPCEPAPRLIEHFRMQATLNASRLAIVTDDAVLCYSDVEARSNQLARALAAAGVRAGTRVALYLARGEDEVLSMLAVLKAGGAYVPLDPTHPSARVQLILGDARPSVLIAHRREVAGLPVPDGVHLIVLDEQWDAIARLDASTLGSASDAAEPAYVLFTSGSTGRPKGVEIPLGALENFLESMARAPGLKVSDRLLAITTTTFDIAGLELLLPLWVGATVRIANRETALEPRLLAAMLEREPVTVMQATPATWRLLLETGWSNPRRIKMLCGGEALSIELARALVATGGELWNLYGPTETTVWSTACRIEPGVERVTIGRPIDRTQVYVVDGELQLVPEGITGELCIGGAGLARGYLDRPELTEQRFVLWSRGAGGGRVYRTGDLARWLPSEDLECLGRVDHQVKVRGFRIELGEIESALRQCQGVRDVVVVARRDEGVAESRLVAYIATDDSLSQEQLSQLVRERLPAYMHPSAYVMLREFPLTTTGKVDRKALPVPGSAPAPLRRPFRPPRTDLEARMAVVWRAVLGLDRIGIDEDFFALGGTSPLAISLLDRIGREFGAEVPLRALFETPTIAAIVSRLGERAGRAEPVNIRLRDGDANRAPLFCLLGVSLYQDLAYALPKGPAIYGLHVPMRYVPSERRRPTVVELARRYVELIRSTRATGPYHLAGLCFGGIVAFEAAQQLVAAGEIVESISMFDTFLPRAVNVDWAYKLSALSREIGDPPSLRRRWSHLKGSVRERLSSGVRGLGALRWIEPTFGQANAAERELNLVGPETVAEARRYQKMARPFPGPLLVFRARTRAEAPWVRIEPELGWRGLSPDLRVYEVAGDHLGIVHEPHVIEIASALAEVLDPPIR